MKSITLEVEAGWELVMMPLAEPPLFLSHFHNCRKRTEQPRAPEVSSLISGLELWFSDTWTRACVFWKLSEEVVIVSEAGEIAVCYGRTQKFYDL